ncbi:MAG: TIGR03435 family protein [Bryobacteraceae bacterium]|jgi:uncharacterized protein (TIGR03435 family)
MNTCLASAIALSAISAFAAQNAPDQPKFEVASVKRADQCLFDSSVDPGSVVLKGFPLKLVLTEAFKVKTDQIVGPSWLDEDCFEIVAKMPAGATRDQLPAMLQALLVERFKLAAHKEDRPSAGYALVVDKNGPKCKESDPNSNFMGAHRGQMALRFGGGGIKASMTMAGLASYLSGRGYGPVQDFTGLKGKYDIDLSWAPDPAFERPGPYAAASAAARANSADGGDVLPAAPTADMFTAVRESLGLRLEPRKQQVEILVIDHIERVPTAN